MRRTGIPIALAIFSSACAVRPATYRYADHILIPPGVRDASRTERALTLPLAAKCSTSEDGVRLRRHGRSIRVTVNRTELAAKPAGWLSAWGVSLEKQGCLGIGEGLALATRITELLPLDPRKSYDLLHASMTLDGYVDLGPEHRLKVTAPILRGDAEAVATGSPNMHEENGKLVVQMRASPGFLGYETAWYAVQPYADRAGTQIVPVSVEDHIDGKTIHPDKPRFNYFQFAPGVGYYRLFYLTRLSQADHDIDILAAAARADLEEQTKRLQADPGICANDAARNCVVIPRDIAVSPYLVVTVNGSEVTVPIGGTVRAAVRAGGANTVETILPTLKVKRLYAGRLVPVAFQPRRTDILDLLLVGGEDIRW